MLALVVDALALVRLRRSLLADLCCVLTNLLLVDALDNDNVRLRYIELNILSLRDDYLMREAQVQNILL